MVSPARAAEPEPAPPAADLSSFSLPPFPPRDFLRRMRRSAMPTPPPALLPAVEAAVAAGAAPGAEADAEEDQSPTEAAPPFRGVSWRPASGVRNPVLL